MNIKNAVLSTTIPFCLMAALAGCATVPTPFVPTEILTLAEISASDPLPNEPALKPARRLAPGIPYAYFDRVCIVTSTKGANRLAGTAQSLAKATRGLSVIFTNSDPEKLKELSMGALWWTTSNQKTHYAMFCIVPPETEEAQAKLAKLPGLHEEEEGEEDKGPVIAKSKDDAQLPVIAPDKAIWQVATEHKVGESFVFAGDICSIGRIDLMSEKLEEGKELSAFLAASNIIDYFTRRGARTYENAYDLLAHVSRSQWNQPSDKAIEAAICVPPMRAVSVN